MFVIPAFCVVNVKLQLFTREEGGREGAIFNDYRVDHKLPNSDFLTMGPVFFLNEQEKLETGQSTEMQVWFLSSNDNVLSLKKGDKWNIFEGKRCVGECEFLEFVSNEKTVTNNKTIS